MNFKYLWPIVGPKSGDAEQGSEPNAGPEELPQVSVNFLRSHLFKNDQELTKIPATIKEYLTNQNFSFMVMGHCPNAGYFAMATPDGPILWTEKPVCVTKVNPTAKNSEAHCMVCGSVLVNKTIEGAQMIMACPKCKDPISFPASSGVYIPPGYGGVLEEKYPKPVKYLSPKPVYKSTLDIIMDANPEPPNVPTKEPEPAPKEPDPLPMRRRVLWQ